MQTLKLIRTNWLGKLSRWHLAYRTKLDIAKICAEMNEKTASNCIKTDFLDGKVAIVAGGCGCIGLACIKEMLRNSLRAVTIADLDMCRGELAVEELCKDYGKDKAIFVKCDATNPLLFDWAFKNTLKTYKRIDLLINCVGAFNEQEWEKQIRVNMNSYVIGSLLGLQYMSKSCKGHGGTVVNVSSIMGLEPYSGCPIYTMTQYGVIGLTKALGYGEHYEHSWVKFMTLCPGFTKSELFKDAAQKCMNRKFSRDFAKELEAQTFQDPQFVARGLIRMLYHGKPASVWVVEDGNDAEEIKIPQLDKLIKKC